MARTISDGLKLNLMADKRIDNRGLNVVFYKFFIIVFIFLIKMNHGKAFFRGYDSILLKKYHIEFFVPLLCKMNHILNDSRYIRSV